MPRTAAAGLRRRISPAGDRHAAFEAITVGTMAAASRITSGPVLGSVSEPEKTFPNRPWADIHMTKAKSAPAKSQGPARRTNSGVSPTTSERAARTQAHCVPVEANWFEKLGVDDNRTMQGVRYELHTMLISAATAGLGIALVPRFFVDAQFERLGLVVPFDAPAIAAAAYYLVYPTELSHGRPLASFREWLLAQAAAYGMANPVLAREAGEA